MLLCSTEFFGALLRVMDQAQREGLAGTGRGTVEGWHNLDPSLDPRLTAISQLLSHPSQSVRTRMLEPQRYCLDINMSAVVKCMQLYSAVVLVPNGLDMLVMCYCSLGL